MLYYKGMNYILSLFRWVNGKKTYFVAAGMVAYALFGLSTGLLDQEQAMMVLFNAAGLAGLRHGVSKGEV